MRNVRFLVLGALVLLSAPFVANRASASSSRLPIAALKIVNYYPSDAGWEDMWLDYSHATTVSDFAAIKSLDANTVRIIIQPAAVGYPTVQPSMRADLDDMIGVARADGLSVQLTLFDMWHDYSDITGSETWVSSMLQGEQDDPAIAVVELQNEMPLTAQSIAWSEAMLPYLKTALPGVPRTISEPGSGGTDAVEDLISDLPGSDIDAIDVHYYGDPSQALTELSAVKSLAGGKPVFVGETGISTYGTTAGETAQARYYEAMGEVTHVLGLPAPAPWMLNDVTRAGGQTLDADQEYFGLRRADGSWKPAAAVVQALFSGGLPEDWDGDMAGESNDRNGTVLGAWTEFDPSAGTPTVTSGLSYDGGQSLCFSDTGGTTSAEPSVEQAFPVLAPAERFTVTGYLARTSTSGDEHISLAGFGPTGAYLGEIDSPAATGSGSWQKLSVSASVPSGVSSIQIHLKTADQSGKACWSDVTITQSAP